MWFVICIQTNEKFFELLSIGQLLHHLVQQLVVVVKRSFQLLELSAGLHITDAI